MPDLASDCDTGGDLAVRGMGHFRNFTTSDEVKERENGKLRRAYEGNWYLSIFRKQM